MIEPPRHRDVTHPDDVADQLLLAARCDPETMQEHVFAQWIETCAQRERSPERAAILRTLTIPDLIDAKARKLRSMTAKAPARIRRRAYHAAALIDGRDRRERRGQDRIARPRPRARAARRSAGARRAAARAPAGSDSPSRPDLAERVRVLEAALAVLDLLERESVAA